MIEGHHKKNFMEKTQIKFRKNRDEIRDQGQKQPKIRKNGKMQTDYLCDKVKTGSSG